MGRDARNNPLSFERPQLPVEACDALGRTLSAGDRVLLPAMTGACVWRVAGIRAVLDPGAPPNLVEVRLVSQQLVHNLRGQPMPEVVLIAPHVPGEGLNNQTPGDPSGDPAAPKLVEP